jgi:hypothetical protein
METSKNENPNLMDLDGELVVNDSMTPQKEIPPKKNYQAVIAMIVAAGTHTDTFPGKPPVTAKKVLAIIELNVRKTDGKRFIFSRKWTFSMADTANMKKDLAGAGVDTSKDVKLKELANLNIMVNVTHKAKQGGGVTPKYGIFSQLPDGMPMLHPETTELPDWAKVYISESVEYKQKYGMGAAGPYAAAIQKEIERKQKYGGSPGNVAEAPVQEDDLPF